MNEKDYLNNIAHNHCERCGISSGLCYKTPKGWKIAKVKVYYKDGNCENKTTWNMIALCKQCAGE